MLQVDRWNIRMLMIEMLSTLNAEDQLLSPVEIHQVEEKLSERDRLNIERPMLLDKISDGLGVVVLPEQESKLQENSHHLCVALDERVPQAVQERPLVDLEQLLGEIPVNQADAKHQGEGLMTEI